MGIQWHPEAYNEKDPPRLESTKHRNVLTFMAQAGDAFSAKQKVISELKSSSSSLFAKLNKGPSDREGLDSLSSEVEEGEVFHRK